MLAANSLALLKLIDWPNIAEASNSALILLSKSNKLSDTFAASVKEVPNAAASIAALASSLADPPKNIAAVSALSAISFITCDGATPAWFANSTVCAVKNWAASCDAPLMSWNIPLTLDASDVDIPKFLFKMTSDLRTACDGSWIPLNSFVKSAAAWETSSKDAPKPWVAVLTLWILKLVWSVFEANKPVSSLNFFAEASIFAKAATPAAKPATITATIPAGDSKNFPNCNAALPACFNPPPNPPDNAWPTLPPLLLIALKDSSNPSPKLVTIPPTFSLNVSNPPCDNLPNIPPMTGTSEAISCILSKLLINSLPISAAASCTAS